MVTVNNTTMRLAIEQAERLLVTELTPTTAGSRCGIAEVNELMEFPVRVTMPTAPSSTVMLATKSTFRY